MKVNCVKMCNGSSSSLLSFLSSTENAEAFLASCKDVQRTAPRLYFPPTKRTRQEKDLVDHARALVKHPRFDELPPLTKLQFFQLLDTTSIEDMFRVHDKSLVTHGDAVGVIAAQSCSERFTQSALNTFHQAGAKKSALVGIKRIQEILDGSEFLKLPFIGPIHCAEPERLVAKTMDDLADESGIVVRDGTYYLFFDLSSNPHYWDEHIRTSPYLPKTLYKLMTFEDNIVYIKTSKSVCKSSYWREKQRHVSGIKNAEEFDREDDTLYFKPKTALGKVRLEDLLYYCPDLAVHKVCSNDIYFMNNNLGIATTEIFLTEEIKSVLGAEGINVEPRHIKIIAANMTHKGHIHANRFSAIDAEDSVILKATFQQGTETFANAAADYTVDNLRDVSSQILMGIKPSIGTRFVHVKDHVVERNDADTFEHDYYIPDEKPTNENDDADDGPRFVPSSPVDMLEPNLDDL